MAMMAMLSTSLTSLALAEEAKPIDNAPAPNEVIETKSDLKEAPEIKADSKSEESSIPTNMSQIVAEFPDGHKITMSEVQQAMASLPPQLLNAPFSKIYEALLNRLTDMKILMDAAKKAGFHTKPDIIKKIEEAKEAVFQKAELDRRIELKLTKEVKELKYKELLTKLPKDEKEVQIRQITFFNEGDAKKALEEITKGKKKFEDVLQAKGTEQNKKTKGDIGYLRKGDVPTEFWDAVTKTKKGEIVSSVQKTGELYLVCLVEDERTVQPPKFDEVEADIAKAMAPEYAVKVIEELRAEAKIKMIGLDGKPIIEKSPEEKEKETKEEKPSVDLSKVDMSMVVAELPSGEKVTIQQIRDTQSTLPAQLKDAPFDQVFELLLKRYVDMRLISEAARKSGVDKDPKNLNRQKEVADLIVQKAYLDAEIEKWLKNNPEEIKKKYEEFKKLLPKDEMEVRLRMILVKEEAKAKEVLKDIQSGRLKFDEAVKLHSIDKQTSENGGDVGYLRKDTMPEGLSTIVFKAAKATLVGDVIKLGDLGYAIVRVEDKRPVEAPTLEQVKPNIMREIAATVAMNILKDLRAKSGAKLFGMDRKPIDINKFSEAIKQPA